MLEVTPSQPLKTESPTPHVPKGLSYSTPSNKQTFSSWLRPLLALALSSPHVTVFKSPLPKKQNETRKNDFSALRFYLITSPPFMAVLASCGCRDKPPHAGQLEQQQLLSHRLKDGSEGRGQGVGRVGSFRGQGATCPITLAQLPVLRWPSLAFLGL